MNNSKKRYFLISALTALLVCLQGNPTAAGPLAPSNLFNIGDSIGEGEAAYGDVRAMNHGVVWSTGFDPSDGVYSLNERFNEACGGRFIENNNIRDPTFNHAESGSVMADFPAQAEEVADAAGALPSGRAGMITILLGDNDVCAPTLEAMTDPVEFEARYRAGLNILASGESTKNAHIHVSSIPDIYWLWVAMRDVKGCPLAWLVVPCQNLLLPTANDCGSGDSDLDPDNVHPDDGPYCRRRKEFHRRIKEIYNPILRDVLEEYVSDGRLPNAYFVDIFDIRFEQVHVNKGDCFHPSVAGHAMLAHEEWNRSPWGQGPPACCPPSLQGTFLLLLHR